MGQLSIGIFCKNLVENDILSRLFPYNGTVYNGNIKENIFMQTIPKIPILKRKISAQSVKQNQNQL